MQRKRHLFIATVQVTTRHAPVLLLAGMCWCKVLGTTDTNTSDSDVSLQLAQRLHLWPEQIVGLLQMPLLPLYRHLNWHEGLTTRCICHSDIFILLANGKTLKSELPDGTQ